MAKVFISYRRSESAAEAGRLFDCLAKELGTDNVFKDVNSVAAGEDFREVVDSHIKRADFFLLLMGEGWYETRNDDGQRRIEDPDDYVRTEIRTALARKVRVVPLLVGGAHIPRAAELPEDIAQLAYRNAVPLRPDPDFHGDCGRLLAEIKAHGKLRRGFKMLVGGYALMQAIYFALADEFLVTEGGTAIGLGLGLVPLIVGAYRSRTRSALLALLGCVLVGDTFGLLGALPLSAYLGVALWRGDPIRYTTS